ncbi:MAG: alanine racemase [Balneolaceae bacterium]|nr:alanine racemase [Balneolaceae bacterium]
MCDKAADAGCEFRPHFKTHQSATIGEWFREHGVEGITVSSLSMAEYFNSHGWDDITIAFPFFPAQTEELKSLNENCRLRVFVNSVDDVQLLSKALMNDFKVYIELDTGYARSGISHSHKSAINSIIDECNKTENAHFHGFYVHHGGTYKVKGIEEVKKIIAPTLSIFSEMRRNYPGAKFSLGDTPSASVLSNFESVDELTPGNFVFYDWMQTQIGSCSLNDVALFALLPIAQISDDKRHAILLGGAVHLSKDFVDMENGRNYGQVVSYTKENITTVSGCLTSLSQEHGILTGNLDDIEQYVVVCPIHSCLTANLHSAFLTVDGEIIEKRVLS